MRKQYDSFRSQDSTTCGISVAGFSPSFLFSLSLWVLSVHASLELSMGCSEVSRPVLCFCNKCENPSPICKPKGGRERGEVLLDASCNGTRIELTTPWTESPKRCFWTEHCYCFSTQIFAWAQQTPVIWRPSYPSLLWTLQSENKSSGPPLNCQHLVCGGLCNPHKSSHVK